MRFFCLPLFLAAALSGQQPNTLTPKEAAEGWILLFDGDSLFGWTQELGGKFSVRDGAITGDTATFGYLRSGSAFADYVLKCEFRGTEDSNSGIFLRSAKDGQPHVTGYELQIWNKNPNPKYLTGSLVNHATAKPAAFKAGVWNSYEIRIEGDRYQIRLNGKLVLDTRQDKTRAGHIGLQVNKTPIEFRNLKLLPLGLKPLFNGKDLSGWRKVEPPKPAKEPAVWSVKNKMLHVEHGGGQLETEGSWADFVAQLDIRTNPKDAAHHPNSGVFLRGDARSYWTGYESQIRNEFKDGDPSKPVDFGTGAIYHYQPTRRIVAKDGEFFTKTIVARGRHFGIWINGYPVTDWEDPHPEGPVVRNKQAKLGAGPISLQAHDPTTNLDFRNIRLAEFPK